MALGGEDWDTAGTIGVGQAGTPTPDPDGDGRWWKFTAPASETLFFDSLLSEFDSSVVDPFADAETDITVCTGTSYGSRVEVAYFGSTFRAGVDQYIGRGVFDVVAGTEYHVRVIQYDNVTKTVFSLTRPVWGTYTQPPDVTNINDTNPLSSVVPTNGGEFDTAYNSGDLAGSVSNAQLQLDMNAAIGLLPAATETSSSVLAQAGVGANAARFEVGGLHTPTHNSGANASVLTYGFEFALFTTPYDWELDEGDWTDPLAGGIGYTNDGLTTYVSTALKINPFAFRQGAGDGSFPQVYVDVDINLQTTGYTPDGSGRTVHTESVAGVLPDAGSVDFSDESNLISVDLDPADYATDGIVWVVPQYPVKPVNWVGYLVDTSPTVANANGDVLMLFRGPFSAGRPLRYDVFTPPQYRLAFAGPVSGSVVPARRLYPRTDANFGRGRDYPPPTTQQAGRRFGAGSPV